MNNFIDEVLAGAPRYTIKNNSGTILYDNVQIVLKTEVTIPRNRAKQGSI